MFTLVTKLRLRDSEMKKILFLGLFLFSAFKGSCAKRERRSAIVPPTSPTRHQFIAGIGVPLELKHTAITLGWVLKAQYFLPETVNQLKFNFFPDIWGDFKKDYNFDTVDHPFPNGRRRREILRDPQTNQSYESYEGKVEQILDLPFPNDTLLRDDDKHVSFVDEDDKFDDQFEEDLMDKKLMDEFYLQHENGENNVEKSDDFDFSLSRWVAYDALSSTLESKGFDGRTCVLRGICEAADVQFSEHLMSELFHIFFTPSTTAEPVSKSSDYDYIKAEQIGRDRNAPDCQEIFHQCKRSIMEIFTEVYDNKLFQFY